jgi:lycopene beta-cyclase
MLLHIILLLDFRLEFDMKHYDYIFTGSGLSALMTIYEMILSEKFTDKSILLLDENQKKSNDRTWCFWDESDLFDEITSKKWRNALFANENFERNIDMKPYQYKMIRGLDFYNLIFDLIEKQDNITFINEKILRFIDNDSEVLVETKKNNFICDKLFNSIYNPEIAKSQTKFPILSQHFVGWFVKTKEPVFNPEVATFMDFSIEQNGNTRFMYVLPTSLNEALLEPTLFSHHLLAIEDYEKEIKLYLKKLNVSEFVITEKEQGNIPMTCYPFWENNSKNIVNIGSAGGWTKASTGFTFRHTIKKAKNLVVFLQSEKDLRKFYKKDKFWFYDLLFLDVLDKNNALGSKIFSSLFKKGNATLIFKFLDEETTFLEDVKLMLKCPTFPFIKAVFKRLL